MHQLRSFTTILFVCLLVSCKSEIPKTRAIGEAFVGPATLPMRNDLSTRSATIATLKHGEKLEVLQTRRSLIRVRNMGGAEGWVDAKHLLSTQQMTDLQRTLAQAERMPSMGRAVVFDALNMHNEPHRQAPSPFQVPPNGSVDVLVHLVTPRVTYRPPVSSLVNKQKPAASPRKPRKKKGKGAAGKEVAKEEEKPEVPPPPMPAAPKLPENWQDLSKTDLPDDPLKPQIRADDWTLVRTPDKKAGWVLTRMLYMAIPDEVAQYAEGKRISSYFSLGEVKDEEKTKHHWLWTTLSKPLQDFDFDGFRIFIYNTKRHRYETAYRENEVRGFYPILPHTVEVIENNKTLTVPGFTLITENDDGQRFKRTFAFLGYRVRFLKKEPVEKPKDLSMDNPVPAVLTFPNAVEDPKPWYHRFTQIFR